MLAGTTCQMRPNADNATCICHLLSLGWTDKTGFHHLSHRRIAQSGVEPGMADKNRSCCHSYSHHNSSTVGMGQIHEHSKPFSLTNGICTKFGQTTVCWFVSIDISKWRVGIIVVK